MADVKLPEGWVNALYGDLFLSVSNGIGGGQNKDGIGLPVSRIETIAHEYIDFSRIGFLEEYDKVKAEKHKLNIGDVLFSHINSPAHLGKTAVFDNNESELYHGINLLRIVVNSTLIYPRIFDFHCKFTRKLGVFSLNAQHAVNQSSINQKKLASFNISLPPLAEQKVIAEKLDTLLAQVDSAKTRLEQIPQILKRFRQSVLAAAVSGKLTEEWREKNIQNPANIYLASIVENRNKLKKQKKLKPSFGEYKALTPLFNLGLENWAWVSFNQICADNKNALKAGPFGSALKKSDCVESGCKVYGQEQVIAGNESLNTYFISEEKFKQLDSCAVAPKDILISLVGTIGKVLILSEKSSPGIINPRLVKISLQHDIDRKYIKYYLDSPIAHGFFKGFSHGGTMDILNLGILKELPIPFPPLEEQTEIVRRVEQLFAFADTVEKQVQDALLRVNNLTQSILAKAFRGELTEQWRAENPDLISGENSAEVLLAKIKAERETAKPQKKSAK